jgi:hypothetical protein
MANTAATRRLLIALKSPVQQAIDPRPRCEECGSVLSTSDFKSYWDDDSPPRDFGSSITPRICNECNEDHEAGKK